jgi:thymidylate synthase (FAD)
MKVKLISVTAPVEQGMTAEQLMVYTARVSSPQNQANLDTAPKLLRYCIKNGHWSVFAMADMTVEIETSRAISAQILRHKSFDFQEFSQRYAEVSGFETYEARRQDVKNRQNSLDDLPAGLKQWFLEAQGRVQKESQALYDYALEQGVAKECARFLLPMSASTRLYMKGSVRSWIHYFERRREGSTQREHRDIADAIWEIFRKVFPVVAEAILSE